MYPSLAFPHHLLEEINRNPQLIGEVFRQFHESEESLPDDLLDSLLGINADTTERVINRQILDRRYGIEQYTYEGTPYNYARWFLHILEPTTDDIVYDLGSGYGRVVFYGALTTPALYKGVEIVPERVAEAFAIKRKFAIRNTDFLRTNVLDVDYADGTIFFLFNPFADRTIRPVIENLGNIASYKRIRIVAWGGGGTEFLRHQSWLHDLTEETSEPFPFMHRIRIFESL